MYYRIGTRGSALALAQAGNVRDTLKRAYPEHEFELKVIHTTGDRNTAVPLSGIGTRGVFVKEIEEQLLCGDIDMAVHSMKDMPAELPTELTLSPCWKREDPRDALILREAGSLSELRPGAVIGTGSLRRTAQLRLLRPDLTIVGIRGNIDTRLRKLDTDGLDGIVLAAAGLRRLGLADRITQLFTPDEIIPAAAQGTLALELRRDRSDVAALLSALSDAETDAAVSVERSFLALMGGGCFLPVGAHCVREDGVYHLRAVFGNADGSRIVRTEVRTTGPDAAETAARDIREKLALR